MNELKSLFILTFITISFLILFESLSRKNILSKSLARKFLHVTTGIIVFYVPFIIDGYYLVLFVGVIFSVTNFILIKKHLLKQINKDHSENFGIFYFPLAFVINILLFWNVNKYLISFSFLIFSISDALAALVGRNSKIKIYSRISKEPKTINGSIAFFISSFILMWIVKFYFWDKFNFIHCDNLSFAFVALIISLVGGITEAISTKGTDNLSLPIILSISGMIFFYSGINISNFLVATFLAASISIISFRLKFLDLGGSAITFILALFIYGIGGWKWTVPILTFFVLSSLLSKVAERLSKKEIHQIFEKGSKRDYKQVLANGGIPLLICILSLLIPEKINWYMVYLLAVSTSTSDTWSTEFGTLFAKNVYMITNFKKVEAGISGGISLVGSIGGILGAVIILFSGLLFESLSSYHIFLILVLSFFGNLIDSLLGSSVQVTYKCSVCNKLTEKQTHCQSSTKYFKGLKFVDNDLVNFASVFFISLVYFIFLIV